MDGWPNIFAVIYVPTPGLFYVTLPFLAHSLHFKSYINCVRNC